VRPVAAFVLGAAACLAGGAAAAQERACIARVDHRDVVIAPGAILSDPGVGLRERVAGWPRALWNRAWGRPAPCDSATTIAFLAGIEALPAIESYCLAEAAGDGGWLLVPGERDWRGRCRRTFCDRVNMTAADGAAVAIRMAEVITGRDYAGAADGIAGFASASGAQWLKGQAAALAGLIGQSATGLGAALASPGAAAAAAVTVIGAGSAVYLCRD
jgi:hypothetical protein